MTTLITGGAGFIGSHLADRLLERGDRLLLLDDLSTGSVQNIRHLLGSPRVQFIEGSVLDERLVAQLVARADRVVHLAAAVGVRLVVEKPLHALTVNTQGTENVLRATAAQDKIVLIASTSEVYGKNSAAPLHESAETILGPLEQMRWLYAATKIVDEYLARALRKAAGLRVIIARFFNVAGPRQTGRYGMVVPRFVWAALHNRPLTIYGDGTQTRCFCHVYDAVEAVIKLLETPAAYGESVNIGATTEISIQALAELVKQLLGSQAEIVYLPYEQVYGVGIEDLQRRVPDISKLRALTGFQPRYTLQDIIRDVADFLRQRPENMD
jgi:UDP-glucose 4-epimerase